MPAMFLWTDYTRAEGSYDAEGVVAYSSRTADVWSCIDPGTITRATAIVRSQHAQPVYFHCE
jgi:hypothetical protein